MHVTHTPDEARRLPTRGLSRLLMGDGSNRLRSFLIPAGFAALTILIGYTLEQISDLHSAGFRAAYVVGGLMVGGLASLLLHRELELVRTLEEQGHALNAAAERLKRQEERVRIAIEATGLVLWGWDLRTNDMDVDAELRRQLGMMPAERMTVDRYLEHVHPDDRQRVQRTVDRLLSRGGSAQTEYRIRLHGGRERTILATAMVQQNAAGELIQMIGALNDITERRDLEERLRQSQKMESIGTLAGGIAHDFNNLLTAMMGHGQFALRSLRDESDVRPEVEAMLIAADRASLLTRQLLAFSRRQILQPLLLDLNDVVRDVARLLHRIIGEDIRLELDLTLQQLHVYADAGQLTQVLLNLATNARDAMPRGGTFHLTTTVDVVRGARAETMDIRPGTYAVVRATDTGIGMDGATLERIFDPYFTTKPVGKGTGLGLSMAYGIVRQSNGHIHVDSQPDVGTTFHVLLPLATEAP